MQLANHFCVHSRYCIQTKYAPALVLKDSEKHMLPSDRRKVLQKMKSLLNLKQLRRVIENWSVLCPI